MRLRTNRVCAFGDDAVNSDEQRSIIFFLLVLAALLAPTVSVRAQNSGKNGTPAESKPGQSTISSYAMDKIENVNLANGNFSLAIPLTTIGGRGTASFNVTLAYNRKVWSSQADREPIYTVMEHWARRLRTIRPLGFQDQEELRIPVIVSSDSGST
jgi:hypothetical protein